MAYPYPQPAASGQLPFILNPQIPFVGSIYGGTMSPGKMIFIQGFVPAGADRFHVNLQCGTSTNPRADIALHFNPRFGGNVVVRNAMKKQQWGAEERGQSYFPFGHNQNFEIIILCEANQFKIAVNGQHFTEFNHRVIRLKRIDTLAIGGKVFIHSVRYQTGPETGPGAGGGYVSVGTVMNPAIPYTGPVVNGMHPGRTIFLSGKVKPNPDRFTVNLQCGVGSSPRPNIAFHFNPRFKAQAVVRNTLQNEKWGKEDRSGPYFPFAPNGFFEIIILCESNCYKVAVNGQHFIEYNHRLPCQHVNTISVLGDVVIHQLRFQ